MKRVFMALLIVLTAGLLIGCNKTSGKKIGFAASTLTNPFFVDVKEGAEKALEGTEYTLVALGANDDAATQANQVGDLIAQGVEILLLNPVNSETVGPLIKEANDAGIPVITFDRVADEGVVVAHVASDNTAGGKLAGEYLKGLWDEESVVLEIMGQTGASAATERSAGFREAFGAANITQSQTANWDKTDANELTEAFLAANNNPKKVFVFAANDNMALGAVEALKANTNVEDYIVVGFDAINDALESIEAGELNATVAQKPRLIGEKAVLAALDYLSGKTIDKVIPIELELIKK